MLKIDLNPFPYLKTQRLILRRITRDDAVDFFAIRSNIEIMAAIDREPLKSMDEMFSLMALIEENIDRNESIAWAVCLKEDNQMIGHFGFHKIDFINHWAEIGYALLPHFQGKGLATEGINAILEYGFNHLRFHSVDANVNPVNKSSIALLIKNGFVKEAHFKENFFFKDAFLDSAIYSLLNKNYSNLNRT